MTQTFLEFKILSSIYHCGAKNYFITDHRCVKVLHKIVWKQTFLVLAFSYKYQINCLLTKTEI